MVNLSWALWAITIQAFSEVTSLPKTTASSIERGWTLIPILGAGEVCIVTGKDIPRL